MDNTFSIEAKLNEAIVAHQNQNFDSAKTAYENILAINPNHFYALYLLGVLAAQNNDSQTASALIQKSKQNNIKSADQFMQLGNILETLNRYDDAIECFSQSSLLRPHDITAFCRKGDIFIAMEKYHLASESFDLAIKIKPSSPVPYLRKALAYLDLEIYEKALIEFENWLVRLQKRMPHLLQPNANLSQFQKLQIYLETTLSIQPNNQMAIYLLGHIYFNMQLFDLAVHQYKKSLECGLTLANGNVNLGLNLLKIEELSLGWQQFEWRFKTHRWISRNPHYTLNEWNPSLAELPVLVWAEQGVGDQILYATLIPHLMTLSKHITLAVEPRLVNLFAHSFPSIKVIALDTLTNDLKNNPTQISIASLGRHLRNHIDDFMKWRKPYLKPNAELSPNLLNKIKIQGKLTCGISWLSLGNSISNQKSIPLAHLSNILSLPEFHFIDLQYTDTSEEREQIKNQLNIDIQRIQEIDNYNDIEGLAALINACDVIVTISNTTAHIAGAMGKKVFLMLPKNEGLLWYWFHKRMDSLWYANVTTFRQTQEGVWTDVIENVEHALVALAMQEITPKK